MNESTSFKVGKRMKILLVASILLNITMVGVFVGQFLSHIPNKSVFMKNHESLLIESLSTEKADFVIKKNRESRQERRAIRARMKELRKELSNIIVAGEFDEKKFDQNTLDMQELRIEITENMADSTREIIKKLTPEERKVFVEHLQKKRESWKRRRGNYQ